MKQHITDEQWDELSAEQMKAWIAFDKDKTSYTLLNGIKCEITIGQLIEFLGEDFDDINFFNQKDWKIRMWDKIEERHKKFESKELIDALFSAVKYKLTNKDL